MKIRPNSSEQMQKTREQNSNLACNENRQRAVRQKRNTTAGKSGMEQWWHSNNNNNNSSLQKKLQEFAN
jgi:hypothetical protein